MPRAKTARGVLLRIEFIDFNSVQVYNFYISYALEEYYVQRFGKKK